MSDEIIKILNTVCDKIGIAVDWSNQNIVPYVKDLLHRCQNYLIINDIFWTALWLTFGGLAVLFVTKIIRILNDDDYDCDYDYDENALIVISLILCVIFMFSLVGFIVKAEDLIQSIFLSEMRLFEYYKSITG